MLELLKSGLKRRTNWNKYQSKGSTEIQNEYLSFLIDPSFNDLTDFLIFHLKMKVIEQYPPGHNIPKVDIKDCNVMTDEQIFFDEPVKNDMRTCNNIR